MIVKKAFNRLKRQQKVFLAVQIIQLDPSKILDPENILWAPKQSCLHQILDQQSLRQPIETALGTRFAVEVSTEKLSA